jgi:hypothetical protein
MKKSLTLDEVKSIPKKKLLKLISEAKELLKKDSTMKRVFSDYGVDISFIDYIPTCFSDLEVSGKTKQAVVELSYELLRDNDFKKDIQYLCHEYTHYLQQCFNQKATKSSNDGNYLNNPYEVEGFQNQIEYVKKHFGKYEAKEYVDNLLDHHEVKETKERKDISDNLMSNI